MTECPRKRVFPPEFGGCYPTDDISKELVIEYLRKYRPSTIKGLREKLADDGLRADEKSLRAIVLALEKDSIIGVSTPSPESFLGYITNLDTAWWIYSMIAISILEMLLVFIQPQNSLLLVMRILFGLLLLGFLPGYSTVKALFPGDPYPPLERVLLSIFLSVVVSIALGTILGIRYFFTGDSSVILIGSYTVALTFIAAYRIYSSSSKALPVPNASR